MKSALRSASSSQSEPSRTRRRTRRAFLEFARLVVRQRSLPVVKLTFLPALLGPVHPAGAVPAWHQGSRRSSYRARGGVLGETENLRQFLLDQKLSQLSGRPACGSPAFAASGHRCALLITAGLLSPASAQTLSDPDKRRAYDQQLRAKCDSPPHALHLVRASHPPRCFAPAPEGARKKRS